MQKNNQKFRKPLFRAGKFYNRNFEFRKKNFEFLLCTGKSLVKEISIFLKSAWVGKSRLPNQKNDWLAPKKIITRSISPLVTWIGHSTFLIQLGNKNIITDPIFGSPVFFFPRIFPAALSIIDLPPLDYILISHNHWDHMEIQSLKNLQNLNPNAKVLVPKGDAQKVIRLGFESVHEFNWWESKKLCDKTNLNLNFLPASHWSQRNLFDQNKSLWGSWMIESNAHKIYFAGDSAYDKHFKEIAHDFKNIDTAILPIGPCEPKRWMSKYHLNAEGAGQAFLDLNANNLVPMHWGTFHFGTDKFDTPILRLKSWWQNNKSKLKDKNLNILKFGQLLNLASFPVVKSQHLRFDNSPV